MQNTRMKGLFTGVLAWAVLVVLAFSLSSALYIEQGDRALLKIQAGRTLSETAESAVRVLDKATAETLWTSGAPSPPNCKPNNLTAGQLSTNYSSTLGSLAAQSKTGINCKVLDPINVTNQGKGADVLATLQCSLAIGSITMTENRPFSFHKQAVSIGTPPNACIVFDDVSKCQEQPTFNSACNN